MLVFYHTSVARQWSPRAIMLLERNPHVRTSYRLHLV